MSPTGQSHPLWDREVDRPMPRSHWGASSMPNGGEDSPLPTHRVEKDPADERDRYVLLWDAESTKYAIWLGIVGPLACLAVDPCVFKWGDEHGPFLGEYRTFCYSFIGLEMLTLAAWRIARGRLGPWCGLVASILLVGSAFAALIGVMLLPLTLLGLLAGIGLLGLIPFLTARAYLRNAALAMEAARARLGHRTFVFLPMFGMVIAVGFPAFADLGVRWGWEAAVRDVAAGDPSAIRRVQFWLPLLPPGRSDEHPLDGPIDRERDPVRQQRLITARDGS